MNKVFIPFILAFSLLFVGCSADTSVTDASDATANPTSVSETASGTDTDSENTETDSTDTTADTPSPLESMVLDYFKTTRSADIKINNMTYVDRFPAYEAEVQVYAFEYEYPGISQPISDQYLFFISDPSGEIVSLKEVAGLYGKTLEQRANEVFWRVGDIEFTIQRDGYPGYYGLGGPGLGLAEANMGDPAEEIFSDWEPIYSEGSYYGKITLEDLEYTYYYNFDVGNLDPAFGKFIIMLSTTRTDVKTYRGAYVGMTRDDLQALYPEANSEQIWSFEGDYLWYGNEMGIGYLIFFYFEDDVIEHIELINMFD